MKNCFIDHWLVNKIVSDSPYALLYSGVQQEGKLGVPIVVKADETQHPRVLICTTDEGNSLTEYSGKFPVILRFINRKKGNFIRMQGLAMVLDSISKDSDKLVTTCINLEILQIAWVYQKSGQVEFYI